MLKVRKPDERYFEVCYFQALDRFVVPNQSQKQMIVPYLKTSVESASETLRTNKSCP